MKNIVVNYSDVNLGMLELIRRLEGFRLSSGNIKLLFVGFKDFQEPDPDEFNRPAFEQMLNVEARRLIAKKGNLRTSNYRLGHNSIIGTDTITLIYGFDSYASEYIVVEIEKSSPIGRR